MQHCILLLEIVAMNKKMSSFFRPFILCTVLFFAPGLSTAGQIPEQDSAPVTTETGVMFTFRAKNAEKVYLAGDFNNWANNDGGRVEDPESLMEKGENDIWFKKIKLKPKKYKYKFVAADKTGNCEWFPDPNVSEKDNDNNSLLDIGEAVLPVIERKLVKGKALKPAVLKKHASLKTGPRISEIQLKKIWTRPGSSSDIVLRLSGIEQKERKSFSVQLNIRNIEGSIIKTLPVKPAAASVPFTIETKGYKEGGYLIEAILKKNSQTIDTSREVLSLVNQISDDMRYGFYTNWKELGQDYDKKADYFAKAYINAIEYYDYFPAHGYYAPKEKKYEFEPFKIPILGEDVKRKIDSANKRNILSIAYVAAYASSKSVFDKYPYPMTDKNGSPRIFNGSVMTAEEAKKQNKDIWFYLMAIAPDTKWYPYIMGEFKRALDDSPGDLFAFHGFEIDSYGHSENDRYYSQSSKSSGELLSKVIMNLVNDVRKMAHKEKYPAAVSFNCVNEYGIKNMYAVVDFIFIENWSGFKSGIEDLTDICYSHRKPRNQRVILKIYPADTKLGQKTWTGENLKYILGAAMTGAGSVMIAGEPDEVNNKMHGLNSLYYPDNLPMPEENFETIKNYYKYDALLYGITHGKNVNNIDMELRLPGVIVRALDSDKKYLVINLLHTADNREWNKKNIIPKPLENYEIAFKMPEGKTAVKLYYGSPDYPELMTPVELDWELKDGFVRTLLPRLEVFGALLIKYKSGSPVKDP